MIQETQAHQNSNDRNPRKPSTSKQPQRYNNPRERHSPLNSRFLDTVAKHIKTTTAMVNVISQAHQNQQR
jgi:hypothetical protein